MSQISNTKNITYPLFQSLFISNVDEFICKSCEDVLKDPIYFSCSHMLCSECYSQLEIKSCPTCSEDITNYSSPPSIIKNLYNKLVKKCHYEGNSCPFQDVLSNIHNHEENCPYRTYDCPDCRGEIYVRCKAQHEASCEKREIIVIRKQNEDLNAQINKALEERDSAFAQRDNKEKEMIDLVIKSNRIIEKQVRDINHLETQIKILTIQNEEKENTIKSLEESLDKSYLSMNLSDIKYTDISLSYVEIYQNCDFNDDENKSSEEINCEPVARYWDLIQEEKERKMRKNPKKSEKKTIEEIRIKQEREEKLRVKEEARFERAKIARQERIQREEILSRERIEIFKKIKQNYASEIVEQQRQYCPNESELKTLIRSCINKNENFRDTLWFERLTQSQKDFVENEFPFQQQKLRVYLGIDFNGSSATRNYLGIDLVDLDISELKKVCNKENIGYSTFLLKTDKDFREHIINNRQRKNIIYAGEV